MKYITCLGAGAVMALGLASCNSTPKLNENNIDEVVAAMTLEEKARLIVGTGMNGINNGDSAVVGETRSIVPGAAGTTYPIPRLGIPAVVLADGPAGLRISPTRDNDTATYYCTHFPIGTMLASTWNPELVEQVGEAIGDEVLEYGVDVLLAPALNIHRNPLCGRNFEYYSEDPLVSGKIAAAYVRGVQSKGVGTSIKHFAVNNQETNRMANDAQVSLRALREIYLKGFETAVKEGKPWTVMSSYNYLNGVYTSENPELLTTLLRDDWGFDGMVMTDWFGGSDAVAQMKAGNDMLQPGYDAQYEAIVEGVRNGSLEESVVDKNVRRILEMIVRTPRFKGYKFSNNPDLAAHAALTRSAASEGMVLLKNDRKALPLKPEIKNVALYGCTSYDFIPGGTGSGNVNRAYTVSLLDGLKNAGISADGNLRDAYAAHVKSWRDTLTTDTGKFAAFMPVVLPPERNFSAAELAGHAKVNDAAIITVGRGSGEFLDRESSNFNLSAVNKAMIADVSRAFRAAGKPVIVVMNVGSAVETASWSDNADAVLCAWQGGQEGGNSVTDVLTGKANPSGKLTMTFPVRYEDHASTANFPIDIIGSKSLTIGNKGPKYDKKLVDFTPYEEDIYVGYRYFDSFDKNVAYPFGYGLSYTTFDYDNAEVSLDGDKVSVSVRVTNTGDRAGKEVVQLYASDAKAKERNKPEKELRGFAKTAELAPGQSETVSISFDVNDLASFDADKSAWRRDSGTYNLLVGASSRDIRSTLPLEISENETPVRAILAPRTAINTLRR